MTKEQINTIEILRAETKEAFKLFMSCRTKENIENYKRIKNLRDQAINQ